MILFQKVSINSSLAEIQNFHRPFHLPMRVFHLPMRVLLAHFPVAIPIPILPLHKMSVADAKLEVEHEGFKLTTVNEDLPSQHVFIFTKP